MIVTNYKNLHPIFAQEKMDKYQDIHFHQEYVLQKQQIYFL